MASKNTTRDASEWMRTQLLVATRELEARFPGANITVLVSVPGCAKQTDPTKIEKVPFSHATTANEDDLRAVVRALHTELHQ